jgi:ribosome-associated translation inhibitor RaiA
MTLEPVVVFRGVDSSVALRREIRRLAQNLEKFYTPITRCDVVVEWSERHHRLGNRFRVRVDVVVPGRTIVVSHSASNHADLQDADVVRIPKSLAVTTGPPLFGVAIRDAFATARRRLQDFARRQRGEVKSHPASRRTKAAVRPTGGTRAM